MDGIKNHITNYVNDNIQNYLNMARFVASFKIEHWITFIASVFLFGIVVANGHHSSSKLLVYGKNSDGVRPPQNVANMDLFNSTVNKMLDYKVPKKYFVHFYIFFFVLTMANQFVAFSFRSNAFPKVNEFFIYFYPTWCVEYEMSETNFRYLSIISNLLLIQSCKRLYEDLFVAKFSNNTMNLLHYIFGLVFYVLVSFTNFIGLLPYYINQPDYAMNLDLPDWVFVCLFVFYLLDQYQNHVHLASLVKYSIPTFRFFEYCASPHYLDEIIMYSILLRFYFGCEAIGWLKTCFLLIWVVVVANLSVSASQSYLFYRNKFGEKFRVEYKLVPYVW